MRVLCCLDGNNIGQLLQAVTSLLQANALTIGLLYITDAAPHEEMERKRDFLLRPRHPSGPLDERLRQADSAAAQDILQEGLQYFSGAETRQSAGRPEREIVSFAASWHADLIVICPRSPKHGGPPLGPKSVGHVARFVLDHAPCPVLLVRPMIM